LQLRNTSRFLLGNLHDYDATLHAMTPSALLDVDQYMLHRLAQYLEHVTEAYDAFAYYRVYQAMLHFVNTDLSAFYFEVTKDRLYTAGATSHPRRSAQCVLYHILDALVRSYASILPHLAEDVWMHNVSAGDARHRSVFTTGVVASPAPPNPHGVCPAWVRPHAEPLK
jgi:isoleucyl-tRNA synthetase